MLILLKQKSKVSIQKKPRTVHQALVPSKRLKANPSANVNMASAEEAKEPMK